MIVIDLNTPFSPIVKFFGKKIEKPRLNDILNKMDLTEI